MARTRGRAKKREQPLGVAIGMGVATTLSVGIIIVVVQLLIPGSVMQHFVSLTVNAPSATLPLDPLYQDWADQIAREDVLFGSPLSLLCGGLVFGWFAPSYVALRRALLAGAALGLGLLTVILAFLWTAATRQQTMMNQHEGGQQVLLTAPSHLVLLQVLCVAGWTAFCILGTWLGLTLRERARRKAAGANGSRQSSAPVGSTKSKTRSTS